MKRGNPVATRRIVRQATENEVFAFQMPPAFAHHLARLAMEKATSDDGAGVDRLPLSLDLPEMEDKTSCPAVFNAPMDVSDMHTVSQLKVCLRTKIGKDALPTEKRKCLECGICQPPERNVELLGKIDWEVVFEPSARALIDDLPDPGKAVKKKDALKGALLSEESSSEIQTRIKLNKMIVDETPTSGRGRKRSSSDGSATSRRTALGKPATLTPAPPPKKRSKSAAPAPAAEAPPSSRGVPLKAPSSSSSEQPQLSALQRSIRNREDYDKAALAYKHFAARAETLRAELQELNATARSELDRLSSTTDAKSLIESMKAKRESARKTRTELDSIVRVLKEGQAQMKRYARV